MPDPRTNRINLRDDDGDSPGPELPEPQLTISITSPANGAVLNEPQNGQPFTVTGTIFARSVKVEDIWVQLGNARFKATLPSGIGKTWSCTVRVGAPGQTTLDAYVSGTALVEPITAKHSVTVNIADTVPPTLNIREPANGQVIPVAESGSSVLLRAEASDHLGIRKVTWEIDGKSGEATRDATTASDWTATVSIPAQSLGNRTITVRAVDLAGNQKSQSVTIVAKDTTPPTFRIDQPAPDQPFVAGPNGVTISVVGSASDLQSGMVGGTAAVKWSLNGRTPFTKAKTTNNWLQWKADIPITDYGSHVIHLRFTDRDGNSVTHVHNVRVISAYQPKDVDERLAPRAYLEDVIRFARDHVTVPGEGPLSSDKLTTVFHQPFGSLSQALSDIGNQSVNQLRVPIEVMRKHLSQRPALLAAHWTFEADSILSGSSIADASGNNNSASTVNGMVLEDGVRGGKALSFDGATRFAQVNHSPTLAIGKDNADFSVGFSLYLKQGATGAWRVVMHKGKSDQERTFALWLHPGNNRLHARISTTSNFNEGIDASAAEVPLNTWTHVTYVKCSNELRLYINGSLDSSVILNGGTVSNTGLLYLGKDPWFAGLNGRLDDVRIYAFALSEESIRALASGQPGDPTPAMINQAETRYRQRAYEALLVGIGTSYTELRLLRGAPREERQALAARLGIRLTETTGTTPDEIEQLTLDPSRLTEAALEEFFGLRDTAVTKDPLRSAAKPRLLEWQEQYLRGLWLEQDQTAAPGSRPWPVVIEPDLIGLDNVRSAVATNTVPQILANRQAEVQGFFNALKKVRESQPAPLAGFDAIIADTLPGTDLVALDQQQRSGADIEPVLNGLKLSRAAFARLVRVRTLAQRGSVTDQEWDDVYHILTQVKKSRRFEAWRLEEQPIGLTPDHFRVSSIEPPLLPWRSSPLARQAWQDTLQARIDQQRALTDAYYANLAAAEEVALPFLRDALVAAFAGAQVAGDVTNWLTEHLLIDAKGSGSLRTTRILQAIETLQTVIFSLRTSRLADGHPAGNWTINENEDRFDAEWKWMGNYATWRAAMSVFLFPENLLWPSLRLDQTQAFGALLSELRKRPYLSPEDARSLAIRFLGEHIGTLQQGLPKPVAHWWFDEGSGDTIADASSNGSTGTRQGASWVDGYYGRRALSFDGQDDRVVIQPATSLNTLQDTFTLAFWANPQSTHEVDQEATTGLSGMSGQKYAFGPLSRGGTTDGMVAGAGVSVGANGVSVYEHSDHYLPARLVYEAPIVGWTHVAVVYQDRRPRLYINGRLVREQSNQSPKAHVRARPDGIGGMGYGFYHGQLDDVRIYAQALSADQIDLLAFTLTDRRTDGELSTLRALCQRLLKPYENPPAARPPSLKESTPAFLKEVFFFVPLQLAMQLQKAGEYVAALDWYQTVYAYNLRPAERKVYYGLELERNAPPDLARSAHWAREWLDPHLVAARRPNPYTRFTLMSIARCCLEFADTEFTRDTGEALARARAFYATAQEVLEQPDLRTQPAAGVGEVTLPNPVLDALRARAELQLAKLRQGRNIAGMKRALEMMVASPLIGQFSTNGARQPSGPAALALRPTPYRYSVLMERSKQLVGIAEQIEAAYLAALEKYDAAEYRRFEANKGLDLANAGVELQKLRVTEAGRGVSLARKQQARADFLKEEYGRLITAGLNQYEQEMIDLYWEANTLRTVIAGIDAAIGATQFAMQAAGAIKILESGGAAAALALAGASAYAGKAVATGFLNTAETNIQVNSLLASHERRVEEWRLQQGLAEQDSLIAQEQIFVAQDHEAVVKQEEQIARTQADQAKATVEFLDRQFMNAELYEWMIGVLAGVYGYFLQQATAIARLAQNQLAFERQEVPPSFIQADYWQPPTANTSPSSGDTKDRRGLTGSVRLLQDIYQLDQYAFESDKRKLNLSQTFSLARLVPQEFRRLRETGVLTFATPLKWFDQSFPGHYLRLIKRVRTSIVALVPPTQGIRATLTASGISHVVVGGDTFREVIIRRDPELVALTSPISSTGVFEMDSQSEMLLPFEAMGVNTTWELQLPKAANSFDYRTIADVLFTIEYTALHSTDYREQVIRRLDRRVDAELPFSLRDQFPDRWYELSNPDQSATPLTLRFTTTRDDFPANVEDVRIAHVLLHFAGVAGEAAKIEVIHLHFVPTGGNADQPLGGSATADENGVISTRRGNGASWASQLAGMPPIGTWELKLAASARPLLTEGKIDDILLVITYSGRLPAWPT